MPRNEFPTRLKWAWDRTAGEVPPVAAVIAAIVMAMVSMAFGDSVGRALPMAVAVGVGTLVLVLAWHWLRAPRTMAAERSSRLANWRAKYEARFHPYPAHLNPPYRSPPQWGRILTVPGAASNMRGAPRLKRTSHRGVARPRNAGEPLSP